MQVAARKDPARTDLPQYSEKAVFEALVNAVVHRDYSMRGSKIRLSMFADRLEIQSPGSLPNNLSVESMASRQSTRNEALTSVLARMPVGGTRGGEDRRYFMERRGDGVPIIRRETWELCGKYPEYRLVDDSEVLLVIPAAMQERSPARAVISVRSGGRPLAGADLLLLFPNKTSEPATTDEQGEAAVDLHTTQLPHDRVRGRAGTCRASGAGLDTRRTSACDRSRCLAGRRECHFLGGDRSPSRIEGQAESHPRHP